MFPLSTSDSILPNGQAVEIHSPGVKLTLDAKQFGLAHLLYLNLDQHSPREGALFLAENGVVPVSSLGKEHAAVAPAEVVVEAAPAQVVEPVIEPIVEPVVAPVAEAAQPLPVVEALDRSRSGARARRGARPGISPDARRLRKDASRLRADVVHEFRRHYLRARRR